MLKGKLKLPLPEKARRVFPDRLGSLVAGFDDKEEDNGGSDIAFEPGEELETFQPNGFGSDRASDDDKKFQEELEVKVRPRPDKDGAGPASVSRVIAADEKRSDLEYELSRPEINLEKLQRIASTGLPDGGRLRAMAWKLLLGYLPPSRDLWEKELTENRKKYANLKEELLQSPSEFTKRKDGTFSSDEQHVDSDMDGPLQRQGISPEDHPLSLGKASVWHEYFQEAMRNILILFAKLNPAIRYVQGMNEVLAPIYFVCTTDTDEQNAGNVEADSFSCFVRLLSDSVDHFCQQLDNSAVGILSTLSRLSELLKANDEELWWHLEFTSKVRPQFYAFRWITLLLTQEFNFQVILRIWDSLLGNPFGVQDMLLRVCCAMLLCVKSRLLSGDFVANLKLLQHYPDINIEYLLQVAQDLSPDTSSFRLSP
ncbi:hypothetical protein F2P56_002762 [Juglans regia]|uniref:TBC1 domain family member 13-like isoform X2 n=2 Tax=Juglans regia TaxID=51240 RepID=A0A2I4F587_JUGRE|nr:TBC1 domain family member 13-like isoform X2 [Juglans regia]KAF5482173.1 hypothetical protein F2P56_002762 [Juglans regia]